jgi:hypothetical protein
MGEDLRSLAQAYYRSQGAAAKAGYYDATHPLTQVANLSVILLNPKPKSTPAVFRNAPSGFSNGNLAAQAHADFEAALNALYGTKPGDWRMQTALGRRAWMRFTLAPQVDPLGFFTEN